MATSSLSGKIVAITGASGILGASMVETFISADARVIALDKIKSSVLDDFDGAMEYIECDITDEPSIAAAFQFIETNYGRVDVLINNAATKSDSLAEFFQPIETYSLKTWSEVMSVNVGGMFLMLKYCLPLMKINGHGTVVQMSSIYGVNGPDSRIYEGSDYLGAAINTPAVYSASKAAVIGLTKWVATVYGEYGIRANAVVAGGVTSGQNKAFDKNYSARVPLQRMASKDEIVDAVLFLASNESSYISGHSLYVDGGLSAW
jgi:NAD(P)-dependent dehydrogenase (short-subunit alcohol dehydrogenase family)